MLSDNFVLRMYITYVLCRRVGVPQGFHRWLIYETCVVKYLFSYATK